MQSQSITALPSGKDSHTLVNEANAMVEGLSALAGAQDGQLEHLTGESLHFLLNAVSEKLSQAMNLMEQGV